MYMRTNKISFNKQMVRKSLPSINHRAMDHAYVLKMKTAVNADEPTAFQLEEADVLWVFRLSKLRC